MKEGWYQLTLRASGKMWSLTLYFLYVFVCVCVFTCAPIANTCQGHNPILKEEMTVRI